MPSSQDTAFDRVSGSGRDMSTPSSPTDTRHPLARVESISEQTPADGLSQSFQSTDTMRRRPETQSYGMQMIFMSRNNIAISFFFTLSQVCTPMLTRFLKAPCRHSQPPSSTSTGIASLLQASALTHKVWSRRERSNLSSPYDHLC
jgi:hypothetical protein